MNLYQRIKLIAIDIALVSLVIVAILSGGCTSYHSGIGLGNDLGEFFTNLQNRLDHGKHVDQYAPYEDRVSGTWGNRIRSLLTESRK